MSEVKELQASAKGLNLLYAEDNDALRLNAQQLLKKLFETVYVAADGQEAFELFKRNSIHILITDIKMPHMDGFALIEKIKAINPSVRIIIMSAFDDKAFLLQAIKDGVFGYLKKPVNVTELTNTLLKATKEIRTEQENQIFFMHLKNVFNYQSSMVLMLKKNTPVMANQIFLDYFGVDTIDEFNKEFKDITLEFLPHDGFLYPKGEISVYDILELNEKKLFHIKMQDENRKFKHFILKYQSIPEKEDYAIVSFDDVTELNLLKLFDEKRAVEDKDEEESLALYDLLEVLQRNGGQIEVHNYYKGLSITHNGIIHEVKERSLTIKTTFLQLKAIQFEQKVLLVSDALPRYLECRSVVRIGFEQQIVQLQDLHFVAHSAVERNTIRVEPDEKHTVSLFIREGKFHGDVTIEDISLDAVRLKLNALPAGLQEGDEVTIDMVLELDKRPLIFNTKARMLRIVEARHSFSVVCMFETSKKNELVKYITKRQMAIIREFKGLQNG